MATKTNKPVGGKTSNEGTQTKIQDSQSWIMHLRHFSRQNSLDVSNINTTNDSEPQYATSSTFDCWLSIKSIDVKSIKWIKLYQMKMSMPVVNSFIEFDERFQPKSLVLAYLDGSIDYSSWQTIEKNFAREMLAGKRRGVVRPFVDIVRQGSRGGYINMIIDQSESIEEAMMLETICFLHKKGEFVYVINFKGEAKIFSIKDEKTGMKLVATIELPNRVVKAQCMISNHKDSITVVVCYLDIPIPIMLQLSPNSTQSQLAQKTEFIFQKHLENAQLQYQNRVAIKLLAYDPYTKVIVTCNQDNKLEFYSLQQQPYFSGGERVYMSSIQRCFSITHKDSTEIINDISVKGSKLAIICQHSLSIYDIQEGVMLIQGEKVKQQLDVGKLVATSVTSQEKPLLIVKKKFNYFDPGTKKSTTLHLFLPK